MDMIKKKFKHEYVCVYWYDEPFMTVFICVYTFRTIYIYMYIHTYVYMYI
jgi:hypothetical protein